MKLRITTLSIVASFVLATAAYAGFGKSIGGAVGGTGGKIGKEAGKQVDKAVSSKLIDDLNNKIAAQNCGFVDSKSTESRGNCIANIAADIRKDKRVIENMFGAKIRIDIYANDNTRARSIDSQLSAAGISWWKRWPHSRSSLKDNIQVVVSKY